MEFIIGLCGAIIGAAASIFTIFIQLKSQAKRDRVNLAANLALEEYKIKIELSKINNTQTNLLPIITTAIKIR